MIGVFYWLFWLWQLSLWFLKLHQRIGLGWIFVGDGKHHPDDPEPDVDGREDFEGEGKVICDILGEEVIFLLDVVGVDYIGENKVEEKGTEAETHETGSAAQTYFSRYLYLFDWEDNRNSF